MSTETQNHQFEIGCEQERLEQQEHNDLLASQYDNFDGRLCCQAAYLSGQIDQTTREMERLNKRVEELNQNDK